MPGWSELVEKKTALDTGQTWKAAAQHAWQGTGTEGGTNSTSSSNLDGSSDSESISASAVGSEDTSTEPDRADANAMSSNSALAAGASDAIDGLAATLDIDALQLPKVALLFLTRGEMPLELLWRAFLRPVRVPLDLHVATTAPHAPHAGGGGGTVELAWHHLFSIYVHPGVNYSYPEGSMFAGHEVEDRVEVKWGMHSVVSQLALPIFLPCMSQLALPISLPCTSTHS